LVLGVGRERKSPSPPDPGRRFSAEALGLGTISVEGPAVYLGFRASSICIVVFLLLCSGWAWAWAWAVATKPLGTSPSVLEGAAVPSGSFVCIVVTNYF
jgi:hypothetical protein